MAQYECLLLYYIFINSRISSAKKLPKHVESQGGATGPTSRGGVQLSNKDSEQRQSKGCCGGGGN